jgi:hypothetical protein
MSRIVELERFFKRLERFQAQWQTRTMRLLEQRLPQIGSRLEDLRKENRARQARVAPGFNVYRILRLERREVLVHTPMLAELLDPEGTHGQGFLFLRTFLETLGLPGSTLSPLSPGGHQWFVETEKPTGTHGNLDILISCRELGCMVAIENKIGAGEQEDQLWRYWNWLEYRKRQFPRRHLVFLTPTGRNAQTAKSADYTPLSYHSDICSWLNGTLPLVRSVTVKETLKQYVRIIENC